MKRQHYGSPRPWAARKVADELTPVGQPITAEKEPVRALRQPRSLRIRAQTDASPNHQGTGEHTHKNGNGHTHQRQTFTYVSVKFPTVRLPRSGLKLNADQRISTSWGPLQALRTPKRTTSGASHLPA